MKASSAQVSTTFLKKYTTVKIVILQGKFPGETLKIEFTSLDAQTYETALYVPKTINFAAFAHSRDFIFSYRGLSVSSIIAKENGINSVKKRKNANISIGKEKRIHKKHAKYVAIKATINFIVLLLVFRYQSTILLNNVDYSSVNITPAFAAGLERSGKPVRQHVAY
ncbi:hypothetical protein ACK3Y4_14185 [Aeromonas caviae]